MKNIKDTDYSTWEKEDFIFHHRKMWNWITNETLKLKRKVIEEEYFKMMEIPRYGWPTSLSYCCECDNSICVNCPIDWSSHRSILMCMHTTIRCDFEGLYLRWDRAREYEEAAELARTIANLPERRK